MNICLMPITAAIADMHARAGINGAVGASHDRILTAHNAGREDKRTFDASEVSATAFRAVLDGHR